MTPQCTHTTKKNGTPIESSRTGDDAGETGVTLVTNVIIDNWDEFEGDPEEYEWDFAQPTTQLPSTAIKASKANDTQ